jgi:hypothetical protein
MASGFFEDLDQVSVAVIVTDADDGVVGEGRKAGAPEIAQFFGAAHEDRDSALSFMFHGNEKLAFGEVPDGNAVYKSIHDKIDLRNFRFEDLPVVFPLRAAVDGGVGLVTVVGYDMAFRVFAVVKLGVIGTPHGELCFAACAERMHGHDDALFVGAGQEEPYFGSRKTALLEFGDLPERHARPGKEALGDADKGHLVLFLGGRDEIVGHPEGVGDEDSLRHTHIIVVILVEGNIDIPVCRIVLVDLKILPLAGGIEKDSDDAAQEAVLGDSHRKLFV